MGLDTKTYWLTDRQSQCNFDFEMKIRSSAVVAEATNNRAFSAVLSLN
jgi:hypothetical protein